LLAGGVAVEQLIPPFSVPGGRSALSILLLTLAGFVAAFSYRRWRRTEQALRLQTSLPVTQLPLLLGASLFLAACFTLVLVLLRATS